MKGKLSEQEQEFFLTGAKTCLDVMEALEEFRRQVQERCLETVKTRLKDLSVASQIEWDSKALRPYSSSAEAHFLGVRIMIESLGGLYFYLKMSRKDGELTFATYTQLWRQRQNLASDLWMLARSAVGEMHNATDLYFGSELTEEHLSNLEEHLNQAIDRFIDFITKAGGLKKYLPPPT